MARGNKPGHRRFGSIRKRESGRYQASYLGPDGQRYYAPETFERKSDADRWLNLKEEQLRNNEWINPELAKVKLNVYGPKWVQERPGLRPRTKDLYRWLLNKRTLPHLGNTSIGDLSTPAIRSWRAKLLDSGISNIMVAKAYRLLRAILWTAVREDKMRHDNPCNIRGADKEDSAERPILKVDQVFSLADLICTRPIGNITKEDATRYRLRYQGSDGRRRVHPQMFHRRKDAATALWELGYKGETEVIRDGRFRALVLLTTFASLRWGEVTALKRADIDTLNGVVHVRSAFVELQDSTMLLGPPKSKAGIRSVAIPATVTTALVVHLAKYTAPGNDALVFTTQTGMPLRRSGFQRLTGWTHAVGQLGIPGLHFHDLRHTGNTMAADTNTSTKNLMARMGHDNEKAALRYQHRSKEADQAIATALDQIMTPDSPAGEESKKDPARRQKLANKLIELLKDYETDDE